MTAGGRDSNEAVPPRWAEWLVRVSVRRPVVRNDILAGLEAEYRGMARRHGTRSAARWYAKQAVGIAARGLTGSLGRGRSEVPEPGRPGGSSFEPFQALRHAARACWRRRGLSAAVIAVVALGIASATSVASVIEALLLRPLPYPDPDRIVRLNGTDDNGRLYGQANPYDVVDWKTAGAFEAMAPFTRYEATMELETGPVRVPVAQVGEGMERVLGIRAAAGRLFNGDDYAEGARSLVLGHAFWSRRLGGDPSIVGRSLRLSGTDFTVVGILPASELPYPEGSAVWLPLRLPVGEGGSGRSGVWLRVVGRLADDVSLDGARAEMTALVAALGVEHPDTNAGRGIDLVELRDAIVGPARPVVALLAGSVALVLLIACANIGNLLLAAAEERRRELAIRAALGSGGGRIARLILAESAVLAGAGAALGLVLAPFGIRALLALYPGGLPRAGEVAINGTVLVLALAATALATLAAGLPPLVEAGRLDVQKSLRAGERGVGGPAARRVRAVLVTAQVALSVALLIGGGLMVRTFAALGRVEPGFEAEGLLTFDLGMSAARYPSPVDEAAFLEAFLERIRAMPGVAAAGSSSLLPLTGGDFLDGFWREGYEDGFPDLPVARLQIVSSGFLETLGMPWVSGRTLSAADDAAAARVVVVNETFARRWFPEGALGRRIRLQDEWREIVGVVADKRHHGLREEPESDVWVPRAQIGNPRLFAWIAVRTTGEPLALVPPIREVLAELDPTIAIDDPRPMSDRLAATLAPERFRAWLVGALAALATLLAVFGIYGLLSYTVARQRREIGIRIALGRTPGGMVGRTVIRAVATTAVGVALGLGMALAAGRFIAAFVPEVGPRDPVTLVIVPVVLLAVAALAALGPARRASRVDPAVALRAD